MRIKNKPKISSIRRVAGGNCYSGKLPKYSTQSFRYDGSTGLCSTNCVEHCIYAVSGDPGNFVICANIRAKVNRRCA